MGGITLHDVAAAASVSIFTASKVLSGKDATARIKPETADRVRTAAQDLGYVTNHAARSLRTNKTSQIGIVLSEPGAWEAGMNPFDGALLVGLRMAALECDLPAIVLYPQGAGTDLAHYLDGRIDGLLVRCALQSDEPLLHLVDPARLPVVALWRQDVPDGFGYADIDHRGGAIQAVQHLMTLGHRRIVCFDPEGDNEDIHFGLRYQGYGDALREAGIAPRPEWYVHDTATLLALCQRHDPVTAAFAVSDTFAEQLAVDLISAGVRIPADLSLVGFDDTARTPVIAGGLTTVSHPMQDMTVQGVRNLSALIDGAACERCRSLVSTQLLVRNSTAPPR